MSLPQFILASASPARSRLLQSVGIAPLVCPSHFDESQVQTTDPVALVEALALSKATAVVAQLENNADGERLVLGCDSVLAMNGETYGKPANAEEAIARWQRMRGQVGTLHTGHALLVTPPLSKTESGIHPSPLTPSPYSSYTSLVRCQSTHVHFANVSDRQIAAYAATGEPLNCAGAFALEGKGGSFVEKLEGCHSNVIGLSLPLLRQMLDELGYDLTNFWSITEAR